MPASGVPEFISNSMYHNSSRNPQAFPIPISPTHHSYPVDPATHHPNRTPSSRHHPSLAPLTRASGTACLQAPFWHYYFSDAVSKGFQSLYDNDSGVLDAFEQFWVAVATRFKDNSAVRCSLSRSQKCNTYEQVIGYELLNEPWVGDFFSDPKQLLARNADARNLVPMYAPPHALLRHM